MSDEKGFWSTLGGWVAKAAPLLGGAILGPGGAALGSLIAGEFGGDPNDPEQLLERVKADPQAAVKLRKIELDHKTELERLSVQRALGMAAEETKRIQAVNETMRAEATSEHWPQWSWRPFNGFMFGITLFGVYFILPVMEKTVPDVQEWVWMAWASILGVAAWHRGKAKRVRAGEGHGVGVVGALVKKLGG